MNETLEQIADRVTEKMYKHGMMVTNYVEFAKRLVEALGAQEPVEYRYKFHDPFGGGFVWRLQPTYNLQSPIETQPLYAAPKPGEVK